MVAVFSLLRCKLAENLGLLLTFTHCHQFHIVVQQMSLEGLS